MIYLFMVIYMIILPILYITLLYKILNKLDKIKNENVKESKITRTHPTIEKSNYNNAFGGRKAYEIYKNKDGLYEPVQPSRGIKIKKEE